MRKSGPICAIALSIVLGSWNIGLAQVPSGSVEPFKKELAAYYDCNAKGATVVWSQQGDPLSLATAVRGLCQREEAALRGAMVRGRTVRFAEEMIKHARSVVLERNAADIVKYRARDAIKSAR